MAKKVIWTKRAINNFNKIIHFLEKEWGENVTKNFVNKTYDIIGLISDQSDLGTLEHSEKYSRFFINKAQ